LRERRRLALPVVVALGGMVVPVAIYLAVNAGRPSASGWGAAMATDTAFALGVLALAGPSVPDRVRTYMLTFAIADDVAGIVVIAVVYSDRIDLAALGAGLALLGLVVVARRLGVRRGPAYLLLGVAAWTAFFESGVDPVVVGLAMGLLALAYPATRRDLERAFEAFRLFREQPTPELARTAQQGVRLALSPNDRLQQLFHPWSSYLVVPLFALANAGITVDGSLLARAYTSPVTLGIVLGYVGGKPAGTVAAAWLLARISRGRVRPPVGWAAVTGAGAIAGIGFTVSLLIASLAFHGSLLAEAKVGVLSAALCASLLGWAVFRVAAMLPEPLRARALLGTAEAIIDLAVPVDPERDHVHGADQALVTLVEYGDYECPYCGQAEPVIRELLAGHGDLRYVWRHLPLTDVHPHALLAAEGAEAAARQGSFWPMHDQLLAHQDALTADDLLRYAAQLGLDTGRFTADLSRHAGEAKISEDVDSADLSGVTGTPTFFVNGKRHRGAYDIDTLADAVRAAKAHALIGSDRQPQRTS
jgi:Na+/H+ antiporter NhaA/glutaredoxin